MTEYKATLRAWADVYGMSGPGSPLNQCLLELRDRIEALEAAQQHLEPIDEAENDRRFKAAMAAIDAATPEQIRAAAGLPERSSLVERVGIAIDNTEYNEEGRRWEEDEARAAIREMAAWFRSGDAGAGSAWTVVAGVLDALLEQEAEAYEAEANNPPEGHPDPEPFQAILRERAAALAQHEVQDQVLARVEFAEREFNCPSDVVLRQYCDDWFYGDPGRGEVDPVDLCRGAIKLFAQIPAPVPVSEGLPEPEDCNAEGCCWAIGERGDWMCVHVLGRSWSNPVYTHWLPHWALPVPNFDSITQGE